MSLNPEVDADIPALLGASAALALVGHAVPGPDRRREGRLQGRPVPAEPDRHAAEGLAARPGRRRHRRRGADGRVRSRGPVGRRDARRRDVRPRADAGRDQRDQRAAGGGRQAGVELAAAGRQFGARGRAGRARRSCAGRRLQDHREAGASRPASRRSRTAAVAALAGGEAPRSTRRASSRNSAISSTASCAPRARGRAAHRRPRHEDGAADHDSTPACCRARTVRRCSRAAKPRRWSSRRSAPAATRRSSMRSSGERKEPFMLHYNFPPFSVGETGHDGLAEAPRNRPRQSRPPRHFRRDAGHDDLPLRHPRRLGNSRIERLQLDGERVRYESCADGRRRADQGARWRAWRWAWSRKAIASRC